MNNMGCIVLAYVFINSCYRHPRYQFWMVWLMKIFHCTPPQKLLKGHLFLFMFYVKKLATFFHVDWVLSKVLSLWIWMALLCRLTFHLYNEDTTQKNLCVTQHRKKKVLPFLLMILKMFFDFCVHRSAFSGPILHNNPVLIKHIFSKSFVYCSWWHIWEFSGNNTNNNCWVSFYKVSHLNTRLHTHSWWTFMASIKPSVIDVPLLFPHLLLYALSLLDFMQYTVKFHQHYAYSVLKNVIIVYVLQTLFHR